MSPSSRPIVGTSKWMCVLLMVFAFIGAAVPGLASSASFLATDTTTSGNWKGVYGLDGHVIVNDTTVTPGYATLIVPGPSNQFTWGDPPSPNPNDPRALLKGASLTARIASTFYSDTTFDIDINLTDAQTHQITLYALDYENGSRVESISVLDASNNNTVLSTINPSGFGGGVYYSWNINGHVIFRVARTSGLSAVIGGIFFGGGTPTTVNITSPAPGNVSGVLSLSASATAAVGIASVQFKLDGANIATPVTGTGPTYSTTWDSSTAPSNGAHTLTAVVTDNLNRTKTSAGVALTISGAGPPQPSATYVRTDTPASNAGNWKTAYGQDGYIIPNEPNNLVPPYAGVSATGTGGITPATFAYLDTLPADIIDPRAMQWANGVPASLTQGGITVQNPPRNPSLFYDQNRITIDVNFTDGQSHQVALYALDFDSFTRTETISMLDGNTNSVLDTRAISGFHNGQYLIWTLKGHVKIQIDNTNSASNLVYSGLFFGGGIPAPTVSISSPAPGPVSGITTVTASATSTAGIASVQIKLDGANLGGLLTTAPYSVPFNTTSVISGSHALSAVAIDTLGQSTTASGVTVTVNNPPPTVSFTNPTNGTTVLGTVNLTVSTSSVNNTIASVQYSVDGVALGSPVPAPFTVPWDTNGAINGTHSLSATATDNVGQQTTATLSVTVSNGGPNVSITTPPPGAISGIVTVTAATSVTNAPLASVQFQVDSVNFGALVVGGGPNFTMQLDSSTLQTGPHTIRGIASDTLGQHTTSAAIVVTVNNPKPTVSMTAPAAGTVVGTIAVSATASSPTAQLVSVQFKVDSTNIATVPGTGPNFSAQWPSTGISNGNHTLTAIALDSLGQTTTSAGVIVNVSNPPPTVSITNPSAGGTVSGTLTIAATANSTIGMASVQFLADGVSIATVNGSGPSFSTQWSTGPLTNGTHLLTAIATDTQNQSTTSAAVSVTVSNTPPTVSVTSPAPGATVVGPITLTANATSSTATIASVQFKIDNVNVGNPITTGAPNFSYQWNSGTVTNGTHAVTALATDSVGLTKLSSPVSITVNNPAPTVSITNPTGAFSLVGTVTVTASAASAIGLASVQFQLDGANLGNLVTGSGPSFTTQWITTAAANGSHVLTAIAKDTQNQATTSNPITVNVSNGPPPPPSAVFLKTDLVTQGNWKNVYGKDGYIIPNDSNNPAPYVTYTATGASPYSWLASTTDVRCLVKGASTTDRIASTFPTNSSYTFDINFNDGQVHQFALYALDYETNARSETVSILNANTNAVLNSQTLSNFNGGVYALWSVQGHVIVKVTYTGGLNAVVSGLFFDTNVPPPPPPTITLISPSAGPASGSVSISANASSSAGISSVQFQVDGTNLGAPVTGVGPIYSFTWDSTTISNGPHLLTAIATDTLNQTTTSAGVSVTTSNTVTPPIITITAPAPGTISGSVTVTASASAVAGLSSVQFKLDGTNLGTLQTGSGPNFSVPWNTITASNAPHTLTAVAKDALNQQTTSAGVAVTVFNVAPSATFIKLDSTTKGNWKGVYGQDGSIIPNDASNLPAYATVTVPAPAVAPPYTWVASTSDVRALLKTASTTDRIASTYYNGSSFTFDVNLTDAQTHQLALYCWDLENSGRTETITILNANTNAVLSTQNMSAFSNGVYAVFNVAGHVKVTVAYTGGLNAVLSGLFISTVIPPPPPPTVSVTLPSAGASVQGTITVNATATANAPAGMSSVQFKLDGNNLGAAVNGSGPTFSTQWNTTTGTNGTHVLTAVATDSLSQATTSAGVSVTSANPVAPPVISITTPSAGPVSGTVTVTANATAIAGMSSVQFKLDGNNLGAAVAGSGPTFTYQWDTTAVTGAHVLTAVAKDTANQTTTAAAVNVTVSNTGPSATFVKLDAVTQGNWKGTYGTDGYVIPNDSNSPPSYAVFSGPGAAGPAYTWVPSTTDVRCLIKGASSTDRIASTYYTSSNFSFDVNILDGQTHQLALYLLDLDFTSRAESITILNANTNAVLVTQAMSNFGNGVYAVFNITGHVIVKFTYQGGQNAVLSGLFFKTVVPPPPPPTVSISTPVSGAGVTGTVAMSATATATAGMASVQFKLDGNNLGSPVTGTGPTFIAQWNSTSASNGSHTLTAVATDTVGQTTTSTGVPVTTTNTVTPPVISITAPAAGTVSGSVAVTANATATAGMTSVQFKLDGSNLGAAVTGSGPTFTYQWDTTAVTGAHTLSAVATDAINQTTPATPVNVTVANTGPSASFVKLDAVTQGNWKSTYGTDGYIIPNDSTNVPSYATVTVPGAAGPTYTWIASTTDVRAPLKGASQTDRIGSTYYTASNPTPFAFDINLTDSQTHQLALYLLDYENAARAETITILNANTNAVLVSQPMAAFGNGVYAVFNVSGHVQVKFSYTSGLNAVLSGLFFSTAAPLPPAPVVSITLPLAGASITGTTTINATATASAGMASVQFKVDGNNLGAPVTGAGPTFTTQWNSTSATNGSHTLTAVATDTVAQTTTSTGVSVTTTNAVTPPVISITAPAAGTVSGVVAVTANATAQAGMSSVQFKLDGSNLGAAVTGSGPTFTYQWDTTAVTGAHVLTAVATDATNQTTTATAVNVTVSNTGPSASFVKLDAVTQGNWVGVYGTDGYIIPNAATNPPSYATVTGPGANGPAYTWVASTADPRALYTSPAASARIASTYYTAVTATPFAFDINFTDSQTHQLALYLWDLENSGRAETITILNPTTNAILVSQPMSAFSNGVYAVFNVSGHVQVKFSYTSGLNAVVSGLFFKTVTPPPPPPVVSITLPLAGASISGTTTINATATASAGMASVQFKVDGNNLGAPVTGTGPTFTTQWNSTSATNGSHTLTAVATDAVAQTTTSTGVGVTTSNAVTPPVISITAPTAGTVSGLVAVTANATAQAGMSSVQFKLDGSNLGAAVTGSGPTFTYQWDTTGVTGAHALTAVATDTTNQTTPATAVNVTVSNTGPTASFVKLDAVTKGNWVGVYGTDGYIIPNSATNPPSYATVIVPGAAGPTYTWAPTTTDLRALYTSPAASGRIASTYYTAANATPFVFDINLTDGQTHELALYLWDLENSAPGRAETITILNPTTNAVLATQAMSAFSNGVYAVFNISGHVQVKFTYTGGQNAVLSGLFFKTNAPPPPPPVVSITLPAAAASITGTTTINATATASAGMASVQFKLDGNNLGAAVTGTGPTFTTQWNSTSATNGSHTLTAVATDAFAQTTTSAGVTVTTSNTVTPPVVSITAPAAGTVSGMVAVTANATAQAGMSSVQFKLDGSNLGAAVTGSGPTYTYQWDTTGVTGAHTLTAVATDTTNQTTTATAVNVTVSNTGPTASFVSLDAVTKGNWVGVYGTDGYIIPNDATNPPSYATVIVPGAAGPAYTWVASTTDVRALYTSPSTTGRIASTYYTPVNTTPFVFDINLTDGQSHQLALYLWDLENSGRAETITILNPSTNAVLATQAMSSFSNGVYAVFNISGHVQVKFSYTAGLNAVLSGLFFKTNAPPPPPPVVSITLPTAGATAVGTVTLNATATAAGGMASLQFKLDGSNLGAAVTGAGPGYTMQWNTTAASNGSHTLTAVATDTVGQPTTSSSVAVTVNNPVTPPVISITSPTAGTVSGTVSVTANATASAGMSSVQFQVDGVNLGAPVTGAGPTYTIQWNTTTTGPHVLTAVATDTLNNTTPSAAVNVTVSSTGAAAYLVKLDTTTQGNWPGVYGADGYIIPNDASVPPAYATVTLGSGASSYTWFGSTTDVRALIAAPASSSHIASTYYSNNSSFNIGVNLTDGQLHQVALYAVDFDTTTRKETISILDATTNAVLVTQPMSSFNGGIYAVFNIRGNVIVKITNAGGTPNIILNGLFFRSFNGLSAPAVSITAPSGGSTVTGPVTLTANATSAQSITSVQFQIDGVNQGSPQTGAGPNYSIQWASPLVSNGTHTFTAIATDSLGLSSTSPAVSVTVSNGPAATPAATFTGTDTTTVGNWVGVYGTDGYMMADGGANPGPSATLPTVISNPPFYAVVNLDGALQFTWNLGFPDSDVQGLFISPTSNIRIGAAYYQVFTYPQGGLPLLTDVTFADNLPHQLALYFVDRHHDIRTQTVTIVDPVTNAVLNTQTITNFSGGTYLKYNIQGHVQVQVRLIVTSQNLNNNSIADSVVMAAMFFDPAH